MGVHTRWHFKVNIRIDSHYHSCCSWVVNTRLFQPPTNTREKNSVALKQIVYLLGCSCCLGRINSEEWLQYNPVFQLHFDTCHIDQPYTWHVYSNCLVTILRHKTAHKNPKYHYVCNWWLHLLAERQFCVNFVSILRQFCREITGNTKIEYLWIGTSWRVLYIKYNGHYKIWDRCTVQNGY